MPLEDCFGVPSGSGGGPPSSPYFPTDEIEKAIKDGDEIFTDIGAKILSKIDELLEEPEECGRTCEAKILGACDACCCDCEQIWGKCAGKIMKAVHQALAECYDCIGTLGLDPPIDDEILQGLQSGNYLGACPPRGTPRSSPPPPPPPDDDDDCLPYIDPDSGEYVEPCADDPPKDQYQFTSTDRYFDMNCPMSGPDLEELKLLDDKWIGKIKFGPGEDQRYRDLIAKQKKCSKEKPSGLYDPGGGTPPFAPPRAVDPTPVIQPVKDAVSGPDIVAAQGALPIVDVVDWSDPQTCARRMAAIMAQGGGLNRGNAQFGFGKNAQGQTQVPSWLKPLIDLLPGPLKGIAASFGSAIAQVAGELMGAIPRLTGCDSGAVLGPAALSVIGGLIERWYSGEAGRLFTNFYQQTRQICPMQMPTPGEAAAAFMGDEISMDDWRCWVRIADMKDGPMAKVLHAGRTRPDVRDTINLFRQGKIAPDNFHKRMREQGVLESDDKNLLIEAMQVWPGFDDVIRFMVRDVWSTQAQTAFRFDDGFEENFNAEALRFANGAGVPKEIARLYWRAHWEMPSTTQLMEMYHRLRPDGTGKDVSFSREELRQSLEINDVLPSMVDRLIEISHRPLTRTDNQRAFFIGAVSELQLKNGYLDEGYNEANADILVAFTKQLKRRSEIRKLGLPSPRELAGQFAKDELSADELQSELLGQGYSAGDVAIVLAAAERRRGRRRRQQRAKLIYTRMRYGTISPSDAAFELQSIGYEFREADALVEEWTVQIAIKEKHGTAKQLCEWRGDGLIEEREQLQGLMALGYSLDASRKIASACQSDLTDAATEKMIKELKAMETRMNREQRDRDQKAAKAANAAKAHAQARMNGKFAPANNGRTS